MKTVFKILIAPLLWVLQSCSPLGEPVNEEKSNNHYYNKKKSDIHYSPMGNWFELGNSPMNADVGSFEVLTRFLGKDENRIYFMEDPVAPGKIDLATFYTKEGDFMADVGFDANQVYVFEKTYGTQDPHAKLDVIAQADPKTYRRNDINWAQDKANRFYRNQLVAVDYASFKNLSDSFSKDKDRAYYHHGAFFDTLPANVSSFEVLHKYYYARDKDHVFHLHFERNNSGPELVKAPIGEGEDVELLNEVYLRIGRQLYHGLKPLDLDLSSMEIVGTYYIKDTKKVYYQGRYLPDADAASFGEIGEYQIGDKNGPYRSGERFDPPKSNP